MSESVIEIPPIGSVTSGKYVGLSQRIKGMKIGGVESIPFECRTYAHAVARSHGMKVLTRSLGSKETVQVYRTA